MTTAGAVGDPDVLRAHGPQTTGKGNVMTESTTMSQTQIREVAAQFTQWHILLPESDGTRDVVPDKRYLLKGLHWVKFLQYERQGTFGGINLGWTDDCEPETARRVDHWRFIDSGSESGPVQYGHRVAIGWDDNYIRYGERTVGINLHWSDTPVFEWRILGGPSDTPVRRSEPVALYNETCDEPLIAFDRTVGGDIGWPTSETWAEQARGMGADMAKQVVTDYLKSMTGGK